MNHSTTPYLAGRRISALLVDDERGAINTLQNMLTEYCPEIEIVSSALSVSDAVQAAYKFEPDLVFLDIEMPPVGSGFDFLKQCKDLDFGVIFITAYPQYAIKAINTIQPWAYLVKPYSVRELQGAVQIAVDKMGDKWSAAATQESGRQRIIIQDRRKGAIILKLPEIIFCRADGSFTDFIYYQTPKAIKITSSRHLGEIEKELPPDVFFRTHHSYIVNLNFIERVERTGRNGLVHLRNTTETAQVSVSKMEAFRGRLED